ncbi:MULTISPECIES: hypothetical protein [unclassified Arthrobacter]|uniref:hypothetical protein n=1 Tax=unclassified Arthrobacter TaxID=235627 RepID=UPI000CE4018B|nr:MULTISPECIES: hypothetical protein [unclassified Arthrobacter]
MSKKQLGAAQGHGSELEDAKRAGWFVRFRALPGFRAAAVAFVLTVVLGVGSTVAYAYWSQSKPGSIAGVLGYALPPPTEVVCKEEFRNRVVWTPVAGLDPDARYIVTFQIDPKKTAAYAVPQTGSPEVVPYTLPGLDDALGTRSSLNPAKLTVKVETAIVANPNTATVPITDTQIVQRSDTFAEVSPSMRYYTILLKGNYPCK